MPSPRRPAVRIAAIALVAVVGYGQLAMLWTTDSMAASRTDVGTAGRAETAAGYAPLLPFGEAEPALSMELRPSAGLRLTEPTLTWTTLYRQRWGLRTPNWAETLRPTLFHQASTLLSSRLSPRLGLQASVNMGAGSMDYTTATVLLSSNTTSLPRSNNRQVALTMRTLGANVSLDYALTPRTGLTGGLSASDQRPLTDIEGLGRFTSFTEQLAHSYAWSQRTTQTTTFSASQTRFGISRSEGALTNSPASSETIVYSGYQGQTSLAHQLSERTSGSLAGGISAFQQMDRNWTWSPLVTAGISTARGRDGRRLTLAATTGVTAFVDTLTGELRTSYSLSATLTRQLGRSWTAQLSASTSMPVSRDPLVPGNPEGTLSSTASVTRRLKSHGSLEFGLRHNSQLTHPNDPDFQLLTPQTWAFVALSGWLGTDAEANGEWAL